MGSSPFFMIFLGGVNQDGWCETSSKPPVLVCGVLNVNSNALPMPVLHCPIKTVVYLVTTALTMMAAVKKFDKKQTGADE